ncbi:MAG: RNA polymerase sigma factor [Polyangiaceae bacterium]|nr:RNA polymerase sigma factor [Polyangiaceae bacterium]
MGSDDAQLITRLQSGDATALTRVYTLYHGRIYQFLLRLSGRRDVADDLFQDTWLQVARDAVKLRPDSDLAAWIFTVARNRYRSFRRWSILDVARIFEFGSQSTQVAAPPDHEVDARRTALRAEAALNSIAADHREVLLLVVGEGMEAHAAGQVLGLSAEAVRQRLRRARLELAKALEKGNRQGGAHGLKGPIV